MTHENGGDANCDWRAKNNPQRIGKSTERLGNRTSRDHPNNSVIKIGQNTEKNYGDLRQLAITHTPGEDQQNLCVKNP